MDLRNSPLVFLHVPKTAGQTIHNTLSRLVRNKRVSPIRVHSQTERPEDQFPAGYSLYSGHLDWTDLHHLPDRRFVFTVLRSPSERIASFYFYLQRQAETLGAAELDQPCHLGLKRALNWSADDYFFGGDEDWQVFIRSHYDNFYCSYFATRRMLGWGEAASLRKSRLLAKARAGLASLDAVYTTHDLPRMEDDFRHRLGKHLSFADRFDNASLEAPQSLRWPRMLSEFATDRALRKMQSLVELDMDLIRDFG